MMWLFIDGESITLTNDLHFTCEGLGVSTKGAELRRVG